jgi:hypothetical protein
VYLHGNDYASLSAHMILDHMPLRECARLPVLLYNTLLYGERERDAILTTTAIIIRNKFHLQLLTVINTLLHAALIVLYTHSIRGAFKTRLLRTEPHYI